MASHFQDAGSSSRFPKAVNGLDSDSRNCTGIACSLYNCDLEEQHSRLMDRDDINIGRRRIEGFWSNAGLRKRPPRGPRRSDQMMQMKMMAMLGKARRGSRVVQQLKINNERNV